MNSGTQLALLAIALIAFSDINNTAKRNRYYAGIRLRITKVDMKDNFVYVTFRIQNPNTDAVIIRSIVGDLYVNNNKVGNVSSFDVVQVNGNAETYITLKVQVKIINTLVEWYKMFNNKKLKITARFVGTMNMNNQVVPLDVIYAIL